MAHPTPGALPILRALLRAGASTMGRRRLGSAFVSALLVLGLMVTLLRARGDSPGRGSGTQAGQVYSVGEALAKAVPYHPAGWVGQVIRLHAVAWPCLGWATGPCQTAMPVLTDPAANGSPATLALVGQRPSSFLAPLRGVPLLDALVPAPQIPRWGIPAMYRVRILAVPPAACVLAPCYRALLLDATP